MPAETVAPNIRPGYSFADGEKNITAAKLNLAARGEADYRLIAAQPQEPAPSAAASQLLILPSPEASRLARVAAKTLVDAALAVQELKDTPAGADKVLLLDSQAGGVSKSATLAGLLYGAPGAAALTGAERLPVQTAEPAAHASVTIADLTAKLPAASGALTGAESLSILWPGGEVRRLSLSQAFTLPAPSTPAAGHTLLAWDGAQLAAQTWAGLFAAPQSDAPAGAALLPVLESGVLKRATAESLARLAPRPGVFRSAAYPLPAAGGVIIAGGVEHGLAGLPDLVQARLVVLNEGSPVPHGYALGEEVALEVLNGYYWEPKTFAISATATRIYASIYWGSSASSIVLKDCSFHQNVPPATIASWFALKLTAVKHP